jgi:hypothetical protein
MAKIAGKKKAHRGEAEIPRTVPVSSPKRRSLWFRERSQRKAKERNEPMKPNLGCKFLGSIPALFFPHKYFLRALCGISASPRCTFPIMARESYVYGRV